MKISCGVAICLPILSVFCWLDALGRDVRPIKA